MTGDLDNERIPHFLVGAQWQASTARQLVRAATLTDALDLYA